MTKLYFLMAVVCTWCGAQPLLPTSEIPIDRFAQRSRKITPGLMIYGLPWLSTPESTVSEFGPPTAILALPSDSFAYFYGKGHIFIFEQGELREVVISHAPHFGDLEKRFEDHPFFDASKTYLTPGLRFLMRLDEAQRLLEGRIDHIDLEGLGNSSVSYYENYAVVTLTFGTSLAMEHLKPGEQSTKVLMSVGIRMQ